MGLAIAVGLVLVLARISPWVTEWLGRGNASILEWGSELHNSAFISVAEKLDGGGSDWVLRVLRWALILGLLAYQRWRHLFASLGAILAVDWLAAQLSPELSRLASFSGGAPQIPAASPDGFMSFAGLSVTLVVMGYSLIPRGRWRTRWFSIAGAAFGLVAVASVYLRVAQPTDVIVGGLLGAASAIVIFQLLVPDAAFPVTYSRSLSAAHLDVRGARNSAIRSALQDQLLDMNSKRSAAVRTALMDQLGCGLVGCDIADLEPFGLAGSAGSTPLRMRIAGDPDVHVFGKLYATNHLRSDRWYKLGRAIVYGSLEDEAPFTSVRRLVEYEDYMLRVMRDAAIQTPQPHGFVEITPNREYLLVTEFIAGAHEIDQVRVDGPIIHEGLGLIRGLWDAGLAHRDIKPANLLIRDGKLILIDVAFATQGPSPWRQAVDLANMMLTLAMQSDAKTVYEYAQNHFAADDIAEAFAATHGVTIPRQLRTMLRARRSEGLDLIEEFRDLAPPAEPIKIQRWSVRRLLLVAGLIVVGLLLAPALGNFLSEIDLF